MPLVTDGERDAFIAKSNVRIRSDGTMAGTQVYFIDPDGKESAIFPVVSAVWSFDASIPDGRTPTANLEIILARGDLVVPAELVHFIHEPVYHITDWVPWYTRFWLWLRK